MTTAAIGHNENAAVKSFIEKRRAIWAARVPVQVKVIALAILEHMTPHNLECYPGKQRLAYMCNMPQNTFDRHYPAAKALFHYHDSRGKPTVFSPKILDVASEIAKLWPSKDDPSIPKSLRYKVPPKMGATQNGGTPKMSTPQNAKSTPQNGVSSTPQNGGPKRQEKRSIKETTTAQAREGGSQEVSGLNGATAIIIEKLAVWINPAIPDRRTAQASLENLVKIYPPEIVRDSFAHLESKMLSGDIVPSPLKYFNATCRGMNSEAEKERQRNKKPSGMSEKIWKRIQEDEAKAKANGAIPLW